MSRQSANQYRWSPEDLATYSAWRRSVLVLYGCIAVAASIVALASGLIGEASLPQGKNSDVAAGAVRPGNRFESTGTVAPPGTASNATRAVLPPRR
jgi:hypothetical protein